MDWIKAKYDRVILLAAALLLIVSSIFIGLKAKSFGDRFQNYLSRYTKSNKVEPLATEPITQAMAIVQEPAAWKNSATGASLFASRKVVMKDGGIQFLDRESSIHKGIPGGWFDDNNFDPLQPDILDQDADGDRFSNGDEFLAKTSPRDAKSHPPFTNKLQFKKCVKIPFRIVFSARDGENCQINTIDLRQPTQFLKVPDLIAGTKFKLEKLTPKECADALGTPKDCSELLIRNVDTGVPMILVVGQIANSPDVYGDFKYLWDNSEFRVKKNGEFQLKPDDTTTYKLMDINDAEARIKNTVTNAEIVFPMQH